MRFASLGSGSAGNASLIQAGNTTLMLDCGYSIKETIARLARLTTEAEALSGILVTHEHDDHAKGVFKLAAKHNIPVWLTYGTYQMSQRYLPANADLTIHFIEDYADFSIGNINIQPYPVPHDAREPAQFVFSDGDKRLGILTDVGKTTQHIEQTISACDALMLECNHDLEMLRTGPYARALKTRVSGELGHLDNQTAAGILSRLDNTKLKHLVAVHISAKNNTPLLAQQALSDVMGCEEEWVAVADQVEGLSWRDL